MSSFELFRALFEKLEARVPDKYYTLARPEIMRPSWAFILPKRDAFTLKLAWSRAVYIIADPSGNEDDADASHDV